VRRVNSCSHVDDFTRNVDAEDDGVFEPVEGEISQNLLFRPICGNIRVSICLIRKNKEDEEMLHTEWVDGNGTIFDDNFTRTGRCVRCGLDLQWDFRLGHKIRC
jgi:hypothetical protein